MNKREAERQRRREERAAHQGYEKLCAQQDAEIKRKHQQEQNLNRRAQLAEENGFDLQYPGCVPEIGTPAENLQHELASAIFWAKLLGIENPAGVEGQTTLTDLCRRIFYEFTGERHDARMWNPYSQKFSQEWHYRCKERFEDGWRKFPESDDLLLSPANFEPQSNNGGSGSAVSVPTAAEQLTSFLEQKAPVAFFSSEVIPR